MKKRREAIRPAAGRMSSSGNNYAQKLMYDADSLALIGPQIPRKAADDGKEQEARHQEDERFVRVWQRLPESISRITLGEGRFGEGVLLMEVLQVDVISTTRKADKLKLHGSVTLNSAYGVSDLFRRSPQNPQVIRARDTLTLTGPDMAALVYDCGEVKLDIKDGGREMCYGYVCFDSYDTWDDMYNKPLVGELRGKNAIGRVTYAIFPCAMLIQVEIKLPKMEICNFKSSAKMATIRIYGQIDASITGEVTSGSSTTTLFRRKRPQDSVLVSVEGDLLPLSKNLMAFPYGGTVEIDLHLKEHLLFESSNCNIIRNVVQCTPKQFGNHKCMVDSKYGPLEVKLTAYPAELHPKTFLAFMQFISMSFRPRKAT